MEFTAEEMSQLKSYLERTLKCQSLTVKKRDKVTDSIEVMVEGEYIGLIYKIIDEGETSYNFEMAILDIDLI
ncbi:MAG: DUF3126 family protein [Alphaproteobacteria bacterium]